MKSVETQIFSVVRVEMLELKDELHGHIDAFVRRVKARFSNIEALDLDRIRKEVATSCIKVCSLIQS